VLPNYTFWKNFEYTPQSKFDPVIAVLARISHKLSTASVAMSRNDDVALGLDAQETYYAEHPDQAHLVTTRP
jgi:hypothetical protein